MKRLLATALIAVAALNFTACSGGSKDGDGAKISVQVEESWLPYYEKVKETVLKNNEGAEIEFKVVGAFDHLDTIDKTDNTNKDVADLFALPADRLYGLAANEVLAPMDAEKMAEEVGGFEDFKAGLGGNLQVDGEYLAFPYNIETLVAYVNKDNATTAGVDFSNGVEFTKLGFEQGIATVHDAWFGVGFANSAGFEFLAKDGDKLSTDATKSWAELNDDQKALFTSLYNYWNQYKGTDLWDKEAAGAYSSDKFKTGNGGVIKIDGPWAVGDLTKELGADSLEVLPLNKVTFNGKPLQHWQGGWGLGINSRIEGDEAKVALAKDFIKELVNPNNAVDLFKATGKILENVKPEAYATIDEMNKKVIDATYEAYNASVARPLFTEYGKVWDSWQNALLSWSTTNPTNAEEAYNQVKASFEAMMANY